MLTIAHYIQQNSYAICHFAALWLYGDSVRTVVIYRLHSDYAAIACSVTVPSAVKLAAVTLWLSRQVTDGIGILLRI